MPVHRFFCPNLAAGRVVLDPAESQHASRVLRIAVGVDVELFDGAGVTAVGVVQEVSRSAVGVDVTGVVQHAPPPGPRLDILTALPRAQRQQFIFEKCTELGVSTVRPLLTARSTVKPQRDAIGKWQRICIEAGKQSGCVHLPTVEPPMTLIESFEACADDSVRMLAATTGEAQPIASIVSEQPSMSRFAVWIGPEGGFTEDECAAARDRGITAVSLGPRVLRIETAVCTVAAWCMLRSESADRA